MLASTCYQQQPGKHTLPTAACLALNKQPPDTLLVFSYFRQLPLVLLTQSRPSKPKLFLTEFHFQYGMKFKRQLSKAFFHTSALSLPH